MFEVAASSIRRKIDDKSFDEAIELIEKLRGTLDSKGDDDSSSARKEWYHQRAVCHEMVGDCLRGQDRLERAMREYEQALSLMARSWSPSEAPYMSVLFKIETLLSMLFTKEGANDQEKRWQAGYLMRAEEMLETGVYRLSDLEIKQQANLQDLWSKSVENETKRRVEKEKRKKEEENTSLANMLRDLISAIAGKFRMGQGPTIIFTTLIMFVACFQLLFMGIKHYKKMTGETVATEAAVDGAEGEGAKEEGIPLDGKSFSPPAAKEKMTFDDLMCHIDIGGKKYDLPYIAAPTGIGGVVSLAIWTTWSKSIWLRSRSFGYELPSGTVLFERDTPEFKLTSQASSLLAKQLRSQRRRRFNSTNPLSLSYVDPISKTSKKAEVLDLHRESFSSWLSNAKKDGLLTPGTIFLLRNTRLESSDKQGASGKASRMLPLAALAVSELDGICLPIGPSGSILMEADRDLQKELKRVLDFKGIVVCEEPQLIKQVVALVWLALAVVLFLLSLRRSYRSYYVLVGLRVGTIAAIVLLVLFLLNNF